MLINSIKKHVTGSQRKRLPHFCPTRWVEKVTGLDDFEDPKFCLQEMSLKMTLAKATSFSKLFTSFYFLSSLIINRSIIDLILPVTQLLQGPVIIIADTHLIEIEKRYFLQNAILRYLP